MSMFGKKARMPSREESLPGRADKMAVPERHCVNGSPLKAPFPAGSQLAQFGLAVFGVRGRKFWQTPGVYSTAVSYGGVHTSNPSYEEVCSGLTGHTELVLAVFDPARPVSYTHLTLPTILRV